MQNCDVVLEIDSVLGECPRWHAEEGRLYWVDIAASLLHRFDPATGHNETRRFDAPVGCFAFTDDGGLILGMKHGFALLAGWDAEPKPFGDQMLRDHPDLRLNDGRTDPAGRFWAGSVNTAKSAQDAALYRLDGDGAITLIENGMTTCNGAAFDATGARFFHADTPSHALRVYDADAATGTLHDCRIFHQFPIGQGRPDGGSVDEEGCYWSALFDGGRVVCLSPAGEVIATVKLPVSRPTMIAFGGEDMKTAYITTARAGLDAEQLAAQPLAGSLFSFTALVPGVREAPFLVTARR
ncbi:MAG: SMP-30/gluconolactonase/LRE family protein [Sphingobium sp.]